MSGAYLFNITDIAEQLNIGESTLKVWRNRYREWLCSPDEESKQLSGSTVDDFKLIAEWTQAGYGHNEIRQALSEKHDKRRLDSQPVNSENSGKLSDFKPLTQHENLKITEEFISAVTGALREIGDQQKRIADTQERRVLAEEKKADAMIRRAEAEALKAGAMADIARALQDDSLQETVSGMMNRLKTMPGPSGSDMEELTTDFGFDVDELAELTETVSEPIADVSPPEAYKPAEVEEPVIETIEASVDEETEDMDDLSLLVSDSADEFIHDMDDLSLLVEQKDLSVVEEMDDLSILVGCSDISVTDDMDDLSLLVGQNDQAVEDMEDMDDMDDLSQLVDIVEKDNNGIDDMDDLSKLVDEQPEKSEPVSKPEPEASSDEGDYKSKILKRIINMKEKEGLSIEETTSRFNAEGVKTLSGKEHWDTKTITGIYKYIDSVMRGKK